jgi:hypothetical protein
MIFDLIVIWIEFLCFGPLCFQILSLIEFGIISGMCNS